MHIKDMFAWYVTGDLPRWEAVYSALHLSNRASMCWLQITSTCCTPLLKVQPSSQQRRNSKEGRERRERERGGSERDRREGGGGEGGEEEEREVSHEK